MADPYTIKIFVPDGNPESVRIIDRMNWTGLGLVIPRDKWEVSKNRDELKRPGVYILYGFKPEDEDQPTVYIGQGDGVQSRIDSHVQSKEFWETAIVFVSSSSSAGLNRAHITWLEYALIKRASDVGRCSLDNGNIPKEPALAESEKAEIQVFLKEAFQILPLVNIRIFEPSTPIRPPVEWTKSYEATSPERGRGGAKDTVIVPARKDGFENVFLGENRWYAIRISGGMLTEIKYIAAYEVDPISAIRYYAPVKEIKPYGDSGKYQLIFSEAPTQIGPIRSKGTGVQGPFYTTIDKLKSAKTIADLSMK